MSRRCMSKGTFPEVIKGCFCELDIGALFFFFYYEYVLLFPTK